MSELYSDFELTEDNCDREPVHRPEAIQGSGHMLAFAAADTADLLALSAGTAELLDVDAAVLWRDGFLALPSKLRDALDPHRISASPDVIEAGSFAAAGSEFALICHWHNDVFFVEFENADQISFPTSKMTRFSESARRLDDMDALCQLGAASLRDALGYDRVMVYQFDPDGHGFVAGEAKESSLEPWLGLHYPASDIPQQARDLFQLNRTRSIPGIHLANRPIHFRPGQFGQGEYLDLGRCQLRATSPVHIQYLKNMGVSATFTVAIALRGELWGLFACHHNSPRNPSLQTRLRAEVFAVVFAQRVHELEVLEADRLETRSRSTEAAFIESLRVEKQYQLRAMNAEAPLLELCPSDGAVVIEGSGRLLLKKGEVPADETITRLREWLVAQDQAAVFATDMVHELFDSQDTGLGSVGGVLAVRVSEISESFVLWFRQQQRQEITWGGDPRKAGLTVTQMADGSTRLSPRHSFTKWHEEIDTKSLPWEPWTLAMATRLREGILKLELRHTADLVARANREFMQLTFSAAHDLQEPLRTQLNYLEFLEEEFDASEVAVIERFLNGSRGAVLRMQDLVNDLLSYAQLGREMKWESIDLNAVMDEIEADVRADVNRSGGTLRWDNLPVVLGDRLHLRQLLRNLVSNAVKYVDPDRPPEVEVFVRTDERSFDLCVRDNGIGIAPDDQERIFSMFTRLHHRREYSGTGIGLAIAKRAAENLSGTMGVKSKPGYGSTFWCRLHKAQIEE